MTTLAKAYPNPRYTHYNNVKRIILEARYVNGQVRFYETHIDDNKEKCLPEDLVKQLINGVGESTRSRPFLSPTSKNPKMNKDFYTVLMRNRQRYQDSFRQLKQTCVGVSIHQRTKFKN